MVEGNHGEQSQDEFHETSDALHETSDALTHDWWLYTVTLLFSQRRPFTQALPSVIRLIMKEIRGKNCSDSGFSITFQIDFWDFNVSVLN